MTLPSQSTKRMAHNTIYLYVRMALIMIVNLFVVRVVLNALGAEDYGIFNLVAGTVTLFSFIGSSLASGATRFLAVDIGKGQYNKLRSTFSMTVYIYCCIGSILVLLLETLGLWFLNTRLNIPEDRVYDANLVFQFTIISFFCNIIVIPYNAAVIAFEKMSFFAMLGCFEALAKIIIAFSLYYIHFNKLILYSSILSILSFIILLIYVLYTNNNLKGCTLVKVHNFSLAKDLLKYAGWNVIGAIAIIFRNQGLIILLNLFFNPIVNAAQTIAQQVYGFVNQLISNVYFASRPQITKLYSSEDISSMWNLVFFSGKIAFYLLLLIVIPLFVCLDFLLKIWLIDVPDYTVNICRLLLVSLCVETMTNQLFGGFQAANRLKKVQSISSSIMLFCLPISYILLKQDNNVLIPYFVIVFLSIIYSISIVIIAKIDLRMSIKMFLKRQLFPSLFVLLITPIFPVIIHFSLGSGWINCIVTFICSITSLIIMMFVVGFSTNEKKDLFNIIKIK